MFLKVVPVEKALESARDIAVLTGEETIPLRKSYGRILAHDIYTDNEIPEFSRSSVDGYALIASDTFDASNTNPAILVIRGEIRIGQPVTTPLINGDGYYIPTGGMVPPGTDAIVMIEHCSREGDHLLIKKPVAPGENLVKAGEDFGKGEKIFSGGRKLSIQDTGALAATGIVSVPVRKKPKIGIISTGGELVSPELNPGPGQVRDVNSSICYAFLVENNCSPIEYGIVSDNVPELKEILLTALNECDAVLISGGSSKDVHDITSQVISDLGKVIVHGIALAPGKPTIIGQINKIPVIGLPGHPASAFVVLKIIVMELINRMLGSKSKDSYRVKAHMETSVSSVRGREDYVRVVLYGNNAVSVPGKSGLLNTLVRSDGMIKIPAQADGIEKGDLVEIQLW